MGAAVTLMAMGKDAKPAIPSLIDLLRTSSDFRVSLKVAFALLVESLKDDSWQVRAPCPHNW
jgi:hypothetical protein